MPKREERRNPTNEMIRKSAEEGKELLESSGGGHSQEQKFQTTSGRGGMRESDKQLWTAMECPNWNYILPYLSKLEMEMWGWTIRRTLCPRF